MAETKFVKTKKEKNYTTLDNTFIKDVSLSWKAKGLMTYFLSLPDDWTINFSEIEKHSSDGRDSLRSAIKELKEHGYLIVEQNKTEEGKFGEMVYSIFETPQTGKPLTEIPLTGKPLAENPKLLNTNKLNTKLPNTNKQTITSESTQHYNSTPADNPCGSEDSTTVSSSSPEPTPFDEPNPFDEPVSHTASTHSDKPNGEQKPRRSTKGSYPNEYYKTIFDTYMSNYKTLLDTGKLKTPLPNIAIMSVKGTLKRCFDAYGYETILKAVKESVNDDWLIEHGYVFHHIFGERKLVMLINGIKYETKKTVVTNSLVKQSLESDYDGEW
jgi:hypothetical protein